VRRLGFAAIGGLAIALLADCGNWAVPGTPPVPPGSAAASPPCAATPIQARPFPNLRGVPWIKATPASAGITAHLFYGHHAHGAAAELHTHGTMPDGGSTKILWLIDRGNVGRFLTLDGTNLTRPSRLHQVFPAAGEGSYPSIVDVPTVGCWQLHVTSGSVAGMVTLRAVQ
jgi:hypothetical protein